MKKVLISLLFLIGCAGTPTELELEFSCPAGRGLAEACEEACQHYCPAEVRVGDNNSCGAGTIRLMGIWAAACKCNYMDVIIMMDRLPRNPEPRPMNPNRVD